MATLWDIWLKLSYLPVETLKLANISQRNVKPFRKYKTGHIPLPKLCVITVNILLANVQAAEILRDTASLTVCRYIAEYKWLTKIQLTGCDQSWAPKKKKTERPPTKTINNQHPITKNNHNTRQSTDSTQQPAPDKKTTNNYSTTDRHNRQSTPNTQQPTPTTDRR